MQALARERDLARENKIVPARETPVPARETPVPARETQAPENHQGLSKRILQRTSTLCTKKIFTRRYFEKNNVLGLTI